MTYEEIKELFQINHPEKFLAFFPGMCEQVAADIFDVKVEDYRKVVSEFKNNSRKAAEELLSCNGFVKMLENIPFKKGDTIVGFGDSITDDYHSWFEILTNVFELHFGKDYFKMVNAGISGDTSLMLIKRFGGVANHNPDWIICMIGTNDSIRNRLLPTRTNITFEETAGNMEYLVQLAKAKTNAQWVWMTPPNVNTEKIDKHPFTEILQNTWNKDDLRKLRREVLSRKELSIDLWDVFGDPVNDELLMNDGLHPSIKGHKEIVKKLLLELLKK